MSESQNTMHTSHIECLPVELLRRIFIFASDNDYDPKSSLNTSRCPWVLTGICHHWRSISVSSPDLWTDIRLTVEDVMPPHSRYGREPWESEVELIQLQLERSKPMPLDIYLYSQHWRRGFPYLDSLSIKLREHHPRWKSFAIWDTTGRDHELCRIFQDLGQVTLPQLERLGVCIYRGTVFQIHCPKIYHLTLVFTCPTPTAFPLGQIEELTLQYTRNLYIRNMPLPFADLVNLRKLTVIDNYTATSEAVVILPRLEILDVTSSSLEAFNFITAPVLHTINSRPDKRSGAPDFKQFIQRSHCTILSLLINPVWDMPYLFNLLSGTPDLQRLECKLSISLMENHPITYELSKQFAIWMKERSSEGDSDGQFKYCPRLRKLVVDGVERTNVEEILDVAEARCRVATDEEQEGDSTLEELVLNRVNARVRPSLDSIGDDTSLGKRIERLRRAGMVIQVNFRP